MANLLLTDAKAAPHKNGPFLAINLIRSIISEKRQKYRSYLGIKIKEEIDPKLTNLFFKMDSYDFGRIYSNLLDNAVESLGVEGSVTVRMKKINDKAIIEIEDTGKGIPDRILPKIFKKKYSYDKPSGTGLGLHLVSDLLKKWGTQLDVKSKEGVGTTVSFQAQLDRFPTWFAGNVAFSSKATLFIVDENNSIHETWKEKIKEEDIKNDIEILSFSSPEELENKIKTIEVKPSDLFLIDHRFRNSEKTGIELIRDLAIGKQSILVCNQFGGPHIIKEAKKLKFKTLPKTFLSSFPIKIVETKNHYDLIQIEDELAPQLEWIEEARKRDWSIGSVSNEAEFWALHASLDTPIFIDYFFNGEEIGPEIAQGLYAKGYKKLYLSSNVSEDEVSYGKKYFIDVLDKSFPEHIVLWDKKKHSEKKSKDEQMVANNRPQI